jgi:hypothetical protein
LTWRCLQNILHVDALFPRHKRSSRAFDFTHKNGVFDANEKINVPVILDLPPTLDHSGLENSASSDSRLAGIAG